MMHGIGIGTFKGHAFNKESILNHISDTPSNKRTRGQTGGVICPLCRGEINCTEFHQLSIDERNAQAEFCESFLRKYIFKIDCGKST